MTRARRPPYPRKPLVSEQALPRAGAVTVASLGMRVRLVATGLDRDSELASLIIACKTLRAEQERLFQQIIEVLSDDAQHGGDSDRLSSHSCRE